MMAAYECIKDFDFAPTGQSVRDLKKGETYRDLTRDCVKKGKALKALKPASKKEN